MIIMKGVVRGNNGLYVIENEAHCIYIIHGLQNGS